ncbi:MAG TPA: HlyD family efflux transporter periplasmic adaptor subunit [Planctomycetes bacterium]|nr:HlyD family efflux transporter periplasmic adaptor subunit [Fuerstiella sp.]HIK91956.1 HlyD family efflux transporter periplasmic adaptor subunit [Planctomycetota bacterium]
MAESTESTSADMIASNQRPIPLQRRADLVVAEIDYLGVGYQVIKDPVGLKYHRLQVEQYKILELLDGTRSLEQVRDELKTFFPTLQVTLGDIQQLITDLHKKCLVSSNRPGQGAAVVRERRKERNQKIKQTFMSLLYLRLPGWDPERTLQWIYPYLAWMFWKPLVWTCMLFVTTAWLMLGAQFDEFQSRLPEFQSFFGWPNLIYLWVTLGIAKIIHEFGHGLSCHHYGGECHEMGMMLLVFSPCLYCDVTDSWMMKNKWHRIIIGAAGMYIEVIISAIAIYVWWFTRPGMLHFLALNTFFVTTITTVIFNANPLMRFDGYYMMSDFLEIPNLRAKSDKMLRESFSWYCLGIESRPDPFMPETGKAWFIAYAIAAWCYRWVILVSISMFLYTVLKPYDLQSLGVSLCIFSMAGIIFSMFRNIYQIVAAPRAEPMSKIKIAFSLTVAGGVGWLVASIPIPWYHQAPFFMEPKDVVHVTSGPLAGQILPPEDYAEIYDDLQTELDEVCGSLNWVYMEERYDQQRPDLFASLPEPEKYSDPVRAGDTVAEGQVLAIMEDGQASQYRDELSAILQQYLSQIKKAESHSISEGELRRDMSTQIEREVTTLVKLRHRMTELVRLLRSRVIYAPSSGTIVAPNRVPAPQRDEINRTKLNRWHGTPLDPENRGCFVDAGEELMSIAPTNELHAVMYIDQSDREDFVDDMEVELKLDELPHLSYVAPMTLMSRRGEKVAPESLTTKYGGTLTTRPDGKGQETLTSTAFRATVEMHFIHEDSVNDAPLIKPGMRGRARILIDDRTAWQWLVRYLFETFRFRL